jgi:hypothetical protein
MVVLIEYLDQSIYFLKDLISKEIKCNQHPGDHSPIQFYFMKDLNFLNEAAILNS